MNRLKNMLSTIVVSFSIAIVSVFVLCAATWPIWVLVIALHFAIKWW